MNLELMAYLTDSHRLWAIDETNLRAYTEAAERHDGAVIEAAAPGSALRAAGSVAVISVNGPIAYRPNIFTALFGGAAVTSIQGMFRQAVNDDSVKAIVMSYDTPGGTITGLSELANEIMASRGRKPIIAQIDAMSASAGYHLASAADRIVGIPSGIVGAIGIITAHADLSAAMSKDGVKVTVISAGKYKSEGSPNAPLTEEAIAAIQARVDEAYSVFVKDIAKARGVKVNDVRGGYAEGRAVSVAQGRTLGMVDGLASLEDTIGQLLGRSGSGGIRAEVPAEDDALALLATVDADRRRRLERY